MTTSQMASSTPKLSEAARHVVVPEGIVTTAWPRVVAKCRDLGVSFDLWQHGAGSVALGKRADGKYAATVGGIVWSIPRQVGKTFLVGMIIIALCLIHPGFTVLWTAHRTRTSTKTFGSMQGMVRRKKIWPFVDAIRKTNGEQEIVFRNGSIIMFGARDQGFGRGFDKVDIEVFDEAQILTSKALEDMVPAANQSQHPAGALLFFIGTPPRPIDPGEEFSNRRDKALGGKSRDIAYVEFSADADADPDDPAAWAKANPSYPLRTPLESMLRMREQLTDDASFKREALGIWDATASASVIPAGMWADCADPASMAVDRFALGVEVASDAARASISFAGARADGGWHVELDAQREGVAWVVPYVRGILAANPQVRGVAVDAGSPSKVLLEEFASAGITVITPKVSDLGAACTALLAGVATGDIRHIDQGQMNAAVRAAGKRRLGDTGMWVWSRSSAASDITPVQSATLALWVSRLESIYKAPLRPDTDDGSVTVL